MRSRSALVVGAFLLASSLTACASSSGVSAVTVPDGVIHPSPTSKSTVASDSYAAARRQAQEWLNAAALPPGAVTSDVSIGVFTSNTGWPCGPVEELEAYWNIPDATVSGTANWLMQNPPADLLTTALGPVPDEAAIESAIVGYIPEPGAQEGIVYTVSKISDGVAVRAEIAALTEAAVCPPLPAGGMYGAPGQG